MPKNKECCDELKGIILNTLHKIHESTALPINERYRDGQRNQAMMLDSLLGLYEMGKCNCGELIEEYLEHVVTCPTCSKYYT